MFLYYKNIRRSHNIKSNMRSLQLNIDGKLKGYENYFDEFLHPIFKHDKEMQKKKKKNKELK